MPALGVWLSPDPLAVHVPGRADLNLYAYVRGQMLRAVDPDGLDPINNTSGAPATDDARTRTEASSGKKPEFAGVIGVVKGAGDFAIAAGDWLATRRQSR